LVKLADMYYWAIIALPFAQIALPFIAVAAAFAAYRQIQTFKRFELMKMLESERVEEARRTLYIGTKKKKDKKWWIFDHPEFDNKLEQAAAIVCGSFDIVWITAGGGNRRFFKKYWAHSILWTHKALEDFLLDRRNPDHGNPKAFSGYEVLYRKAKRHDPRAQSSLRRRTKKTANAA